MRPSHFTFKAPFTLLHFCYDAFFVEFELPGGGEKHPFLCFHIDLPDNKYGAKDIRFCAFTLLWFCEARYWILER